MMGQDPFSHRMPKLFWKCVAISLAAHFLALLAFYLHPLWISHWADLFPRPSIQQPISFTIDESLLDGVFDDLIVIAGAKKHPFDTPYHPSFEKSPPLLENIASTFEWPNVVFAPFSFYFSEVSEGMLLRLPSNEPIISHSSLETPKRFLPPQDIALSALDLPAIDHYREEERISKPSIPSSETLDLFPLAALQTPASPTVSPFENFYSSSAPPHSPAKQTLIVKRIPRPKATISHSQQDLLTPSKYGVPSASPRDWRHLFNIDVQVMPRKEQEGVFFAVTLNPKPEAMLNALKQNFHFVIDGTKYTSRHLPSVYKRALQRSLSYLEEGQTFNIYFIDKETRALSSTPLPVSKRTVRQATDFLEKEHFRGVVVRKTPEDLLTLFSEIGTLAKERVATGELDTVILFTDGKFVEELSRKQVFKTWLGESAPFVLYAATIGNSSYPAILDLMTAAMGGKVFHSQTNAAFPRKFAKLVLDLKAPIATHLELHIIPEDDRTAISLMGTCCKVPPLFASQPCTFYGLASAPAEFSFFLEGRGKDQRIDIALDIDLKKSRAGSINLKEIALHDKAQHALSLFLQSGSDSHFKEALEWLKDPSKR